jgi:hypothetical protein
MAPAQVSSFINSHSSRCVGRSRMPITDEILWNALPTACLRDLSYDPFCVGCAVTPTHRMWP